MKKLNDVVLADLMPGSIASDSNVDASAKAIDPHLRIIAGETKKPSIYARIDELTSRQLDHLAIGYNFTVWRDTWPIALKRSVAKQIIAQKSRMGTLSAVRLALESIGAAVQITEWWQETPKATPHTFKINVVLSQIEGILTSEMQEDVFALLDDAKPKRSHYTFVLSLAQRGGLQLAGVHRPAVFARIQCGRETERVGLAVANAMRPVAYAFIYN